MRIRGNGPRALGLAAILAAGLAAGCNCNGGTTETDSGTDAGPPGDPYAYVTTALRLPMAGEDLGVDLDGDGMIDNALGTLLNALGTLVGMGFDAQGEINTSLMEGSLVMLWNVTDVNAFDVDTNVFVDFYIGEDAMMDLAAYTGNPPSMFTISATSPAVDPLPGQIAGGALVTEPSNLPLVIPLPMMGGVPAQINITLVSGIVECPTLDATALNLCVLGGAISQEQIDTEIVPAIIAFINGGIIDAAVLDPTMMTVPCTADAGTMDGTSAACTALGVPDARCSAWNGVDMGICVDGADGLVGFALTPTIDMDGNGMIIPMELETILGLVLQPDLDLATSFSECDTGAGMCGDGVTACTGNTECEDACNGAMNPDPSCAGVNDALSIGLEFSARTATIAGL